MKSLAIILIAVACFTFTQGYIPNLIHKKGYCVWYDQCLSSQDKSLNCLYNGPAKTLNNTDGIVLLNKLCPKFSQNRLTCCSTSQLQTFENNLNVLRKIVSSCPSCWQNILNMYCEVTCSPDQSMFVIPTQIVGFPPIESIVKVDYYVSMDFKVGLFESCKGVVFRGNNHPYSDICSKSPRTCPPQIFLEYLSSSRAGIFGFDIKFPQILPSNITWLKDTTYPCNHSFVNQWTNKTFDKCTCMDCNSSCGHQPRNITRDPYDSLAYRKAVLKINSTYLKNHTGYHRYPDNKFIPFGPIFHLDLLNQALDLQLALTNMKVPYTKNNKTVTITLNDVCYKPPTGDKCVIESVFQYFQNNRTRLNYCVTAMGHKCAGNLVIDFFKADYHDHLLYCTRFHIAPDDKFWGGGPCLGANSSPFYPRFVLEGYNDFDYKMAKYLIISFVFNNHTEESKNEMTRAWEKAFLSYMKEYIQNLKHSNLTITFSAQISDDHEKSTTSPRTNPDVHGGNARVYPAIGQLLGIVLSVVMLSHFIPV